MRGGTDGEGAWAHGERTGGANVPGALETWREAIQHGSFPSPPADISVAEEAAKKIGDILTDSFFFLFALWKSYREQL